MADTLWNFPRSLKVWGVPSPPCNLTQVSSNIAYKEFWSYLIDTCARRKQICKILVSVKWCDKTCIAGLSLFRHVISNNAELNIYSYTHALSFILLVLCGDTRGSFIRPFKGGFLPKWTEKLQERYIFSSVNICVVINSARMALHNSTSLGKIWFWTEALVLP